MTIKIRNVNIDEADPDHYWFQIYGPDSVDATVRIAIVDETGLTPEDWLASNLVAAQAMVDAGDGSSLFCRKQEAKNFIAANPVVKNIYELGPTALEAGITGATAGQIIKLRIAYAYAARITQAILQEEEP